MNATRNSAGRQAGAHTRFEFAGFVLDIDRGMLLKDGVDVPLRPKSFDVLCHLVEAHGILVTKDQLLDAVWQDRIVTDQSLTQCLKEIRQALGDDEKELVRTLPRRGYMLDTPVEVHGPGHQTVPTPDSPKGLVSHRRPSRWTMVAVLMLTLAILFTWWRIGGQTQDIEAAVPEVSPLPLSIAVLPFEDMSPDGDQQYLGDGISEEILNQLVQVSELNVIARTSSFSFKGQNVDVATIADRLNVEYVLEGSVRKDGDMVRITTQLVEATNGLHLWSQTYNRPLYDIFAIQDEISAGVVDQLTTRLFTGARKSEPISPEAYELFLQASHIMETNRVSGNEQARERLERVLELTPDYLPAWAELARSYYHSWQQDDLERVREIVDHMASIAPDSSWANHFQGWIAFAWDGNPEAAARYYERAIADDPYTPAQTLRIVARLLVNLGRIDEGIAVARHNLVRDPACEICAAHLARQILKRGYVQEARTFLEETMEWQAPSATSYLEYGLSWLIYGEPETAMQSFERVEELNYDAAQTAKMLALADLEPGAEFDTRFAQFRENYPDRFESIARIYAWSGNQDMAIEYIDRWIERRGSITNVPVYADMYFKLHANPRFQELFGPFELAGKDLSHVEFNPRWPPALQAAINRANSMVD